MIGQWTKNLAGLAQEYETGTPFPLLVIDDFLDPAFAREVLSEFPSIEDMKRSHDYVFGDKRQSTELSDAGPACRKLHDWIMSSGFAEALKVLTGRELFLDPAFHGGGFHQGGDGSFLDTHVDFNIHPDHADWLRVLNILIYLNEDWKEEYDGNLLVRQRPSDEPRAIAPLFNRCVIMLTSDNTYHGYRPMSLPAGVTRKSIASYAYEIVPTGSTKMRTTSWAPEQAGPVKRALAKHWTTLAGARSRIGGRP